MDPNKKPEETVSEAPVYHFCIPATKGDEGNTKAVSFDGTTSNKKFLTSEIIYVYNNTSGALLGGTLQPTNLNNDDKNCDLVGDLTGVINPGDELTLYYNAVDLGFGLVFLYTIQDGTAEGVLDGATATVTVSSTSPLSTTSAHFNNLASMFRLKFKDEIENPIEVHALTAYSKNVSLISQYMPLAIPEQQYARGCMPIRIASPTTAYLYLSLFFDESLSNSSDALTFIAEDNSYLYLGEKTAPPAGFKNGKYYYNTAAIQLTKVGALQAPTITWNNPNVDIPALALHDYSILTNDIDIELTGTSLGYYFYLEDHNTSIISFNNLTAAKYDMPFIGNPEGSMTLNISGDNSIDCRFYDYGILADQTLKLQGSGTLTVTTNLSEMCGLLGALNYNPLNNGNATTDALDVSTQLAADGYTVTRSARTNNGNGTYTWTYTVASAPSQTKSINAGDVTVPAGEHWLITGTGSSTSNKITIGAGATVTLDGVDIYMYDDSPCIECLGSATIILKDGSTNQLVSQSDYNYPPLWVGNEGTTLTIQGSTGSLQVTSTGRYCAAIGGGWSNTDHTCGNIVIEGGVIIATGGTNSGAGIGSDDESTCGTITISGGRVTAEGRGSGAGIGSGNHGDCGDITITDGAAFVEAIMGSTAPVHIGPYSNTSQCTVTIDGVVNANTSSSFTHFDSVVSGSRWTLTHK
ncbi:MAG: hypothetical protein IKX45_07095 [Bacteroidales bacterium]|nr:hypothetical protein [Bacteroidales bacterium]